MNIIKVDCLPLSIFVGYERENDARGVTFDYSAWAEKYGDGVLQLLVQRPGDADPYPVVLTAGENNTADWLLSATDTAVKGWLEIQLIFTVGSVVAKTAVLPVLVDRSLAAGATPPDPYETWLETLTELAEQILHTTQPPEIRNGYWYIFDPDTGEYVNSGVKAEGEDGVGITGAQLNADYTLTLTFSDGTSYTTPSIRGAQGEPGPTPQLSIGTVTTGAAGSSAAVEITGTPEAPVLNFTIPRGDTGEVSEAELQAALLDKADVITDTASGAIASFPDGAAAPVKALTVAVEPVQDLHGYNAPWPAGGGVNKFNIDRTEGTPDPSLPPATTSPRVMDTAHHFIGITRNNYYDKTRVTSFATSGTEISVSVNAGGYGIGFPVAVSAETAYTLSFVNISNGKISLGYYDASWNYLSDRDGTAPPYTFTTPENCAYVVLVVTPNVASSPATIKDVQLELGSTATAWTPYSNECPIGGWSSVGIDQAGKNLFPYANIPQYAYAWYAGSKALADATQPVFVKGGKTYILSFTPVDANDVPFCLIRAWHSDGTILANSKEILGAYNGTSSTTYLFEWQGTPEYYMPPVQASEPWCVIQPTEDLWLDIRTQANKGVGSSPMLEISNSTPTDYSAYVGNSYTISLGQTVYGGTLEYVRNGDSASLRFVGTHGIDTYNGNGTEWTVMTGTGYIQFYTYNPSCKNSLSLLSNLFPTISASERASKNGVVSFNDRAFRISLTTAFAQANNITDGASFNSWLANNPLQIYYPLDTPFEISLTPEEIETLKGTNNFWSDAGDVSVEYRADTKLYIEKKITAAIAAALNS